MELSVTFRHCRQSERLKERAMTRLEHASRIYHRPRSARAIFDKSPEGFRVELILKGDGQSVVASCEADTLASALDGAAHKMEQQGRRHHSRRSKHKNREGRLAKEQPWSVAARDNLPRHQPSYP